MISVWLILLAAPIGIACYCLGARRRQPIRLEDHSEYQDLKTALASFDAGVWIWESPTQAVHWDVALEKIFGLQPGEFDGTYAHWASLLNDESKKAAEE